MATLPTETQLQTVWGYAVAKLEAVRQFGNVNATNYVTVDNTLSDSLYPDHARAMQDAMAASRSALASMIGTPQAARELRPLLTTYARVIGVPDRDAQAIIDEIYQHFIDNSYTVASRGISFGSVSAGGSNVGNGTVTRLTVDENSLAIESVYCEDKTVKCIADEHSGATEHEELFTIYGEPLLKDDLENVNSGFVGQATALSGRTASRYLSNPSFDVVSAGTDASPTTIQGWTMGTAADFQVDRNTYYRDYVGTTSPGSLLFENNNTIEQNLNVRNVTWDPKVPAYCQVAIQRSGSCDGTFTLTLGNVTKSVDVTTLTNGEWAIVRIGPSSDNWFKNWNKEDPLVKLALASRTTGTLYADDVILAPMTRFGSQVTGTWIAVVGGETPFLRDDVFTFTDTDGGTGKIQRWAFRGYGRYFPHTGATPTWADPS